MADGQPAVWMREVGSAVPRRAVGATYGAWLAAIWLVAAPARAQEASPSPASPGAVPATITIKCSSKPGERQHCPADTSHGVTLARSAGASPCMLGRTWGYDEQGVWVSDGCAGEFLAGRGLEDATGTPEAKEKAPAYIPNMGFLIVEGQKGEMYARLFSYVRYLNQKGLDPTYTDSFGNTRTVPQRQDVQLNKFFLALPGWFLTPKFRYYLYVWSANTSQGDPAQVVGAGWMLFSAVMGVILGLLLLREWPLSGLWAIGTLVGVNLLFSGFSMISVGSAARSVARAVVVDRSMGGSSFVGTRNRKGRYW